MMTDVKATIGIDVNAKADAIRNVEAELQGVAEVLRETAGSMREANNEMRSVNNLAMRAGAGVGAAGATFRASRTSIVAFGSAVRGISPTMADTVQKIGNLSGALGYLPVVMNPAGAAMVALAGAAAIAINVWSKHKEEIERAAAATAKFRENIEELEESLKRIKLPAEGALDATMAWARSMGIGADIMKRWEDERLLDNKEDSIESLIEAIDNAKTTEKAWQDQIERMESQLRSASEKVSFATRMYGENSKQAQQLRAKHYELTDALKYFSLQLNITRRDLAKYEWDLARIRELEGAPPDKEQDKGKGKSRGYRKVMKEAEYDWKAHADRMIAEAIRMGDWTEPMRWLEDKDFGHYIQDVMKDYSDEQLRIVGLEREQRDMVDELIFQRETSVDVLKAATREYQEQERLRQGQLNFEEIMRNNNEQARAEREALKNQMADQIMTIGEMSRSYAEMYETQVHHEENMLRIVEQKLRLQELLTEQEMQFMEEYHEKRMEKEKEEYHFIENQLKSMKQQLHEISKSAAGLTIGTFAQDLGAAAVASDDFSKSLAESALQGIAGMARQYGTFFTMQGMGWLMTPAMEDRGAKMMLAGAGLMAIGGAVGAIDLGGSKAEKPKNNTEISGRSNIIVDTYEKRTSGQRSRDFGAERRNGNRYGIDRKRNYN